MVSEKAIREFGSSELWKFMKKMFEERIILSQIDLETAQKIDHVRMMQGALAEDRWFIKLPEALINDYLVRTGKETIEEATSKEENGHEGK